MLVVAAGLLAMAPSCPAFAHATIVSAEPSDGANLAESPKELRLRFAERVSLRFSTIQLLDANARTIDALAPQLTRPEPDLLALALPSLEPGVYTVFYRTLSETDGHFTRGWLVFGVGAVPPHRAGASATESTPPFQEVLLRWSFLGFLLTLVGAIAVVAMVLDRRGMAPDSVVRLRRMACRRIVVMAALCASLGCLAGLGQLWYQAVALPAGPEGGNAALGAAAELLLGTRWGNIWLLRELLLATAAAAVIFLHNSPPLAFSDGSPPRRYRDGDAAPDRMSRRWPWRVAALSTVLAAAAQALMGHAAGLPEGAMLAVAADLVHLLAAGVWVGGILTLAVGLLPQLKRGEADFAMLVRAGWGPFSKPAAMAVALLLATGLFSLGQQVASVDALVGTSYGRVLIAKIALVSVMGGIGVLNAQMLHPMRARALLARIFDRELRWTMLSPSTLPGLIKYDVALALLVLLATSAIVASPPPWGPEYLIAPEDIHQEQSRVVDDVMVTLSIKPNLPGANMLNAIVTSTHRPAPAEITRVIMRFMLQDRDLGRTSVVAKPLESNRFVAGGNQLSMSGRWAVDVVVRRSGLDDVVVRFDWMVPPPGEFQPTILSKQPWRPVLEFVALAVLTMLAGAAAAGVLKRRRRRAGDNCLPVQAPSETATPARSHSTIVIEPAR
ncbi:MAG: copper resistance CopC/CopD family protein [Hypericibacter sp.]